MKKVVFNKDVSDRQRISSCFEEVFVWESMDFAKRAREGAG